MHFKLSHLLLTTLYLQVKCNNTTFDNNTNSFNQSQYNYTVYLNNTLYDIIKLIIFILFVYIVSSYPEEKKSKKNLIKPDIFSSGISDRLRPKSAPTVMPSSLYNFGLRNRFRKHSLSDEIKPKTESKTESKTIDRPRVVPSPPTPKCVSPIGDAPNLSNRLKLD